jgi:hypothetical protein
MFSSFFGKPLTEIEKLEKELSELRVEKRDIEIEYDDQVMMESLGGKVNPAKLEGLDIDIKDINEDIKAIELKIAKLKPKVYRALKEEEAVNGRNLKEEYERFKKAYNNIDDEFQKKLNTEKTNNDPHSVHLLMGKRTGSSNLEKLRLKRKLSRNRMESAKNAIPKKGGSRKTSYNKTPKRATRKSKIDL